jgi:hypothetical protein
VCPVESKTNKTSPGKTRLCRIVLSGIHFTHHALRAFHRRQDQLNQKLREADLTSGAHLAWNRMVLLKQSQ